MRFLKENEDTAFYKFMPNGFSHSLCRQTRFFLPLLPRLSMLFSFGNPVQLVTSLFLFLGAAFFASTSLFLLCCESSSSAHCHQTMPWAQAIIKDTLPVKLDWLQCFGAFAKELHLQQYSSHTQTYISICFLRTLPSSTCASPSGFHSG